MQLKTWILGGLLVFAQTPALFAQTGKSAGFVDFESSELFDDEDIKVDVSIRGALLNLMVEATKEEDSEFSELVSKLESIRVQVFSVEEGRVETIQKKFGEMAKSLDQQGWERVVRVREKGKGGEGGERIDTYLKTVDNRIAGLVVLVVDPHDEAVFVNIVGEIDPAQIGRIGRKLRIDPLEGLSDSSEVRKGVKITLGDEADKAAAAAPPVPAAPTAPTAPVAQPNATGTPN